MGGPETENDPDRAALLREACESLASGRGILLVGSPGFGRTHVLRAIISAVDESLRGRLWVRDDDLALDDVARRRLGAAMRKSSVLPILTSTERDAFETWQGGGLGTDDLVRVQLAPFSRSAMLTIVQRLVGGPLDPRAVPVLVPHRAGGDLVVLAAALHELKRAGALVESGGRWRLIETLPPLDSTRQRIHRRLGVERGSAEETALDLIALAPELGIDRTRELMADSSGRRPQDVLESLEADGAIDVTEHGADSRVRLHDPAIELLLPLAMGRLRRRRLSNEIVTMLSRQADHEVDRGELLALARLALPLGWPVDGTALTRAAETALRSSRIDLAAHLAAAALTSGAGVDASFVLAAAESQAGRSEEAVARLERLRIDDVEQPDQARIREELIALVGSRIADPKSLWSLPDRRFTIDGEPASATDLAALSSPDSHDVDTPEPDLPGTHAAVLKGEQIAFEASLAVMRGQSDLAVEMLDDAETMLRRSRADTFRVRWGKTYSLLWDQPFGVTYDQLILLADEAAALGQAEQEALCRWSAAWTLGYAGRVTQSVDEFRGALISLERLGLADTAQLARIAMAKSLAGSHRDEEAWALLDPALAHSAENPMIGGWAHEARGWVLRGEGRRTEAAEAFIAAAVIQGSLGFSLSRIIALSGAARSGAARDVLPAVDEIADAVDGRCVAVLVRQVRALAQLELLGESEASGSGGATDAALAAEFDRIGSSAVELDMHGVAAEAFMRAAALYRSAGVERAAVSAERRAIEQTGICGAQIFSPLPSNRIAELSDREREIARLASAGLSNREIAERLVLSVRTVETHLLRVFRKLGVRSRAELPGAVPALDKIGP